MATTRESSNATTGEPAMEERATRTRMEGKEVAAAMRARKRPAVRRAVERMVVWEEVASASAERRGEVVREVRGRMAPRIPIWVEVRERGGDE